MYNFICFIIQITLELEKVANVDKSIKSNLPKI